MLRQMPYAVPTAPLLYMLSAATMPWLADIMERLLWRVLFVKEDGLHFQEFLGRFVLLEWAFVVTLVITLGLQAVTLATVLARRFPNVRDVWLGLLVLTACAAPATVLVGTFFAYLHMAADAWPPTIVFMVTLLLGSCLLRHLTNQEAAGAIQEIEDMSRQTSFMSDVTPTNTPQLTAEIFEAAVDNGLIARVPSNVSDKSGFSV